MGILVVDDSRAMRMIVLRELRKAGYETKDVMEAENGRAALEKVRLGGVDLVLSDWNMPEMSGMGLLQAMRREGIDIPFGFVTSESTPVMHRDALDAGADFVVTKPFSADSLSAQVEKALEGHRQADGLGAAVAPEQVTLTDLLEDLFGKKVTASPSAPPRPAMPGAIARYRGEPEGRESIFAAEMPAAASLGAALSMLPPAQAEDAAESDELPEVLERNFHEVVNVLSKVVPGYEERWYLEGSRVVARLGEEQRVKDAGAPAWAISVELKVNGYPAGRVGFLRS